MKQGKGMLIWVAPTLKISLESSFNLLKHKAAWLHNIVLVKITSYLSAVKIFLSKSSSVAPRGQKDYIQCGAFLTLR